MTREEADAILVVQQNRCGICYSKDTGSRRTIRFFADHNHETGKFRGFICHHCNRMLGDADDSPGLLRIAADYLEALDGN